jgi:hypothetical protein
MPESVRSLALMESLSATMLEDRSMAQLRVWTLSRVSLTVSLTLHSPATIVKLTGWKAVGDQIYIMFDSGVRGAADVFKAIALGAKFVFVGKSAAAFAAGGGC